MPEKPTEKEIWDMLKGIVLRRLTEKDDYVISYLAGQISALSWVVGRKNKGEITGPAIPMKGVEEIKKTMKEQIDWWNNLKK